MTRKTAVERAVFEGTGRLYKYQPFHIRQEFYYEEPIEYEIDNVPLGIDLELNDIFALDFSTSKRILVLGRTGSGKTILMSSLIDRLIYSGLRVFSVDYKGEFVYKYLPNNDKRLIKYLLKGEKPAPINIMSLYPIFLTKRITRKLAEHETYLQFSFRDLTADDFKTLLNIQDKDTSLINFIDYTFSEYVNKGKIKSLSEYIELIQQNKELHELAKRKLIAGIKALITEKVIGDEGDDLQLDEWINEGIVINLNLKGMASYTTFSNPATTYLAILLRKLYTLKVEGRIKKKSHLVMMIDEAHKFIPNEANPSSKQEFLRLLDVARAERISLFYATQDYRRIPQTLINQANYIFIPLGTPLNEAKDLFKDVLAEEYTHPSTFPSKVASILRKATKYKSADSKVWIVLDKDERDYVYLRPTTPLSRIVQERTLGWEL